MVRAVVQVSISDSLYSIGKNMLLNKTVDFAITTSVLPTKDLEGRTIRLVPVLTAAWAIVYNLPGFNGSLVLSREATVGIFNGTGCLSNISNQKHHSREYGGHF
jgi:hypothetical protein